MPTVEELQEEYGLDDDAIEAFREALAPESLRKQLSVLGKENKELREKVPDLESKVAELERGPARLTLLKDKLGIEESSLPPAAKRELASKKFEGDEPTDEELAAFAADYNVTVMSPGDEGAESKTDQIVTASNAQRQEGKAASGTIKPEEATDWSFADRAKFRQAHPEEWAALLEGKEVAVAFTPSG